MGAVLALVARYRFLHHTAVSFVSSDIRVFETTRLGGVSDADATSALRRTLAITYASRRLDRSHRNLDAHEDVNIEFSGLPYVCAGEVLCVLACRSRRLIPLDLDGT